MDTETYRVLPLEAVGGLKGLVLQLGDGGQVQLLWSLCRVGCCRGGGGGGGGGGKGSGHGSYGACAGEDGKEGKSERGGRRQGEGHARGGCGAGGPWLVAAEGVGGGQEQAEEEDKALHASTRSRLLSVVGRDGSKPLARRSLRRLSPVRGAGCGGGGGVEKEVGGGAVSGPGLDHHMEGLKLGPNDGSSSVCPMAPHGSANSAFRACVWACRTAAGAAFFPVPARRVWRAWLRMWSRAWKAGSTPISHTCLLSRAYPTPHRQGMLPPPIAVLKTR